MKTPTKFPIKHRIAVAAVGLTVFFASLWGGAWLCSIVSDTYAFPAIMTAVFCTLAGGLIAFLSTYPDDLIE